MSGIVGTADEYMRACLRCAFVTVSAKGFDVREAVPFLMVLAILGTQNIFRFVVVDVIVVLAPISPAFGSCSSDFMVLSPAYYHVVSV